MTGDDMPEGTLADYKERPSRRTRNRAGRKDPLTPREQIFAAELHATGAALAMALGIELSPQNSPSMMALEVLRRGVMSEPGA